MIYKNNNKKTHLTVHTLRILVNFYNMKITFCKIQNISSNTKNTF